MKKNLFFIILITSSILMSSCSNNQVEQFTSDVIKTEISKNEHTQVTPTPVSNDFIPTPTPISNKAKLPDTSIQKAYNPDDFVSTSFSDIQDKYSYSMPCIDINSDDVKAINKEIKAKYGTEIEKGIELYQRGMTIDLFDIHYSAYINGTILSLLIVSEYDWDFTSYQTYNVDVSTGNLVSNTQLLRYKNITKADFLKKAQELYSDEFINQHGRVNERVERMKTAPADFPEEEIELYKEEYTSIYNKTIDEDNYGIDTPMYLGSNGNLNIIATIYSLAGSESYDYILTVEE